MLFRRLFEEFEILTETFFFQVLLWNESERSPVDAVAEARGPGAIGKDVTEMRIGRL